MTPEFGGKNEISKYLTCTQMCFPEVVSVRMIGLSTSVKVYTQQKTSKIHNIIFSEVTFELVKSLENKGNIT